MLRMIWKMRVRNPITLIDLFLEYMEENDQAESDINRTSLLTPLLEDEAGVKESMLAMMLGAWKSQTEEE